MSGMADRGFNLALLRGQLTAAEQRKETARINLMSLHLNNAKATDLAAAQTELNDATAAVERLRQEVAAAEHAG
jgi:hypothetical protein